MLFQAVILLAVLTICAVPFGRYMAKVFNGEQTVLSPIFGLFEDIVYGILKIDPLEDMSWKTYAVNLVAFNIMGMVFLFVLLEIQHLLPFNPQGFGPMKWDTALNTAVSFTTNTNWQAYSVETTVSYFTQMFGLAVQNFLSAAVGIAAAIAFMRGFVRHSANAIGNFWVDITRSIIYILLPLSVIFSLILVSSGVVQTLMPYAKVTTLEGVEQVIARGPVASQAAIKILGTNGGGFFNANSAHPYENPKPFTDWLEILALLIISTALPFTFGAMMKNKKQGWALYSVMMALFLIGLSAALWSEFHGNPLLAHLGVNGGVNMEGKEVRFGTLASVVFAHATTCTACGAVNAMHDSLLPLTGLIPLFNMMIGEVIFGGVGVGILGLMIYAILTMFLVGLMIGRTPEIFGKKLEPFEMLMATIAILVPSIIQLTFGAIAISTKAGLSSLNNAGPHGLSEILYAFASGAGNNGSAFAGINADTRFYNLTLAATMFFSRFTSIIPPLAIAGVLAVKKRVPESAKFPTASPLFVGMLVGVVIVVGALTFFPALALGPILEHVFMLAGRTF
jgi:K+-transporting ATPase ATPase A chain